MKIFLKFLKIIIILEEEKGKKKEKIKNWFRIEK